MTDLNNELLGDTCWVYIERLSDGGYFIGITYEEEFLERESIAGRKLIFRRRFEDTFSAAGYRMVLDRLSEEQLKTIIKEYNKT